MNTTSDGGNSSNEDCAGSGVPRTVDGRARDKSFASIDLSALRVLITEAEKVLWLIDEGGTHPDGHVERQCATLLRDLSAAVEHLLTENQKGKRTEDALVRRLEVEIKRCDEALADLDGRGREIHAECHELHCNGDRRKPRGRKGITCNCRGWDKMADAAVLRGQLTAAEAQRDHLRGYAQHKPECAVLHPAEFDPRRPRTEPPPYVTAKACTCGLSRLLTTEPR